MLRITYFLFFPLGTIVVNQVEGTSSDLSPRTVKQGRSVPRALVGLLVERQTGNHCGDGSRFLENDGEISANTNGYHE